MADATDTKSQTMTDEILTKFKQLLKERVVIPATHPDIFCGKLAPRHVLLAAPFTALQLASVLEQLKPLDKVEHVHCKATDDYRIINATFKAATEKKLSWLVLHDLHHWVPDLDKLDDRDEYRMRPTELCVWLDHTTRLGCPPIHKVYVLATAPDLNIHWGVRRRFLRGSLEFLDELTKEKSTDATMI